MLFDIIYWCAKYGGISILLIALYAFYTYILAPFIAIRKYRKYPNVYVNQKFIPLVGEGMLYREDIQNKRASYYHQIEIAGKAKGIDLKLAIVGDKTFIYLISNKALQEFQNLTPKYIDRNNFSRGPMGKLFADSFVHDRSNEKWKKRRDTFLKEIGINFSSRFIPMMIEETAEKSNKWQKGQTYDLLTEMADITFTIISEILFGKSVLRDIENSKYEDPSTGEISYLPLNVIFTKVFKDINSKRFSLKHLLFPCLQRYNLTHPFNVNKRNINEIWRVCREYLEKSEDKESVYARVMMTGEISKEDALKDLIGFLFAGHETSSHSISSALFNLTKDPHISVKLRSELHELIGLNVDELKGILTKDKVQSFDYLYQIVKETLRFDNPAHLSLPYEVVNDTSICDVPLSKGTKIQIGIIFRHFDPDEWKNPLEFIPERFNPESEHYTKPNTDKTARNSLSYIPFSFWFRSCPGQTLALLEIRVIVAYLFMNYNFKFDEETINSPYSFFGVASQLKMNFKITD